MSDYEDGKFVVNAFSLLIGAFIFIFLIVGFGYMLDRTFRPAEQQIERKTFEESKSYRDGTIQNLRKQQFDYETATPDQQKGMAGIIIHEMDGFDESVLPSDLKAFVDSLKAQRIADVSSLERK